METIIVWGIGRHIFYMLDKYYYPIGNIEAVIDSNPKRKNEEVFGKKLIVQIHFQNLIVI